MTFTSCRAVSLAIPIAAAMLFLAGSIQAQSAFLPPGTTTQAAQAPKPVPPQLKVDIVLTRTQGEKKISSLPFTLWVSAAQSRVSLRMGVDVPVGTTTTSSTPPRDGAPTTTTTRPDYRHVGTQIDCTAWETGDGRYFVDLRITDSAIFSTDSSAPAAVLKADPAAFKSFTFNNVRPMRVGQSEEFARAADPITGEVLRVDVTVNIVK